METTEALRLLDVSVGEEEEMKVNFSTVTSLVPPSSALLATVYGTVGPVIVSFGLIGNTLILVVVARSNMTGTVHLPPPSPSTCC